MKKITFVLAVAAITLFTSSGGFASAKEKRTDNLHTVTYSVSDCL